MAVSDQQQTAAMTTTPSEVDQLKTQVTPLTKGETLKAAYFIKYSKHLAFTKQGQLHIIPKVTGW